MKDMQSHLEKLRVQVAECEMIRDLATDPAKRELFARLAQHHKVLVSEIERAIAAQSLATTDTLLSREAHEPLPKENGE